MLNEYLQREVKDELDNTMVLSNLLGYVVVDHGYRIDFKKDNNHYMIRYLITEKSEVDYMILFDEQNTDFDVDSIGPLATKVKDQKALLVTLQELL